MSAAIISFPKRERKPNCTETGKQLDALVDLLMDRLPGANAENLRRSLVELKAGLDQSKTKAAP